MGEKTPKKTVRTLATASFLNDLGSDMIYPVWPLFVTALGANMAVLGLIDGLGNAVVSISQAVSGYLSDRLGKRKLFVWLGYLFGALSRIGYALTPTWHLLIPFRALDRAGKMRSSPRDAIIADVSTDENRGGNFGILRAMDNLGAVCGIVITIFLFDLLGYRNLFLIAAVPSLAAMALVALFVKDRKTAASAFKGVRISIINRNYLLFLLSSSLFALGSFSYSFLLVFADKLEFKSTFIPVLYLIFTVFAFASSLPVGRISDRLGRKPLIVGAFILWGLVCMSFIFMPNRPGILAGFILYGLHRGALDTVQNTLVSELVPDHARASGLGGFQMVIGICALPASLIAGFLWDAVSVAAPFYFSLAATGAAVLVLLFVKKPVGLKEA